MARLIPIGRRRLTAAVLIRRFRSLTPTDLAQLRSDIDAIVDQSP